MFISVLSVVGFIGSNFYYENMIDNLINAVEKDDVKAVELILSKNSSLLDEYVGDREWTPLHYASASNSIAVMELLLKKGANVYARKVFYDYSPLDLSVRLCKKDSIGYLLKQYRKPIEDRVANEVISGNCPEAAFLLIDRGINVNSSTANGGTMLEWSIRNDHSDVAIRLIEVGADVNKANNSNSGSSPLMSAVRRSNIKLTKLLLENGANVFYETSDKRSVISNVIDNNSIPIVKLLINAGVSVNSRLAYDLTPLHLAAKKGDIVFLNELISKGSDVNAITSSTSYTPLHYAAGNGYGKIVEVLARNGADLNAADNNSRTALHYAIRNDFYEVAKVLIDYGIDLQLYKYEISSVFSPKILTLLMDSGLSANKRDDDGESLLFFAARQSSAEVVKILIKNGAEINQFDVNKNLTPLMISAIEGKVHNCAALVSSGANQLLKDADGNTALHLAIKKGNNFVVNCLTQTGYDINLRNGKGLTPLELAVKERQVDVIDDLVKAGANVNSPFENSLTPIQMAAINNDGDLLTKLIRYGADVNYADGDGNTALHHSILNNNRNIVDLLFSKKANVRIKNNNGKTAYDLSKDLGDNRIKKMIEDHLGLYKSDV